MFTLSSSTRKQIDWRRISDAAGMLGGTRSADERQDSTALTDADRKRLRETFVLVREEFAKALASMKSVMKIVLTGVSLAVACAVAGGALLQVTVYAGIISVASIGALIGLLGKVYALARDQAMLELVPARYELAIEFCRTQADAREVISRFLAETSSIRAPKGVQKTE